jgi:phage shock protein A
MRINKIKARLEEVHDKENSMEYAIKDMEDLHDELELSIHRLEEIVLSLMGEYQHLKDKRAKTEYVHYSEESFLVDSQELLEKYCG